MANVMERHLSVQSTACSIMFGWSFASCRWDLDRTDRMRHEFLDPLANFCKSLVVFSLAGRASAALKVESAYQSPNSEALLRHRM